MNKNSAASELRKMAVQLREAQSRGGLNSEECHNMAIDIEDIADLLQYMSEEECAE